MEQKPITTRPPWLTVRVQEADKQKEVISLMQNLSLHTVCGEANCPNLMECFGRGTAAFMILGKYCTRNCTFCCVEKNTPQPVDADEPLRVARAVAALNLRHVVVTSVTRDDLSDGGAAQFAALIRELRSLCKGTIVEVLIPDFQGDKRALSLVMDAKPDILNHNLETVPRLYPEVRPMADYARSLALLKNAKEMAPSLLTKSGIMAGLGETQSEVLSLLADLRSVSCDLLTIGQYLAPSKGHHPVVEYVHPDVFKRYEIAAKEMGFKLVASAPLVRSSYHADRASELFSAAEKNDSK
ncbi:MAG: lipoyl synthase [Christensenellales bacterium]